MTYSRNGCKRWCGDGACCLCVMGGELEECGDRKVIYVGGSRKRIVVNEGTRVRKGAENGNGDYMQ